jgi:hypothetical protein
MAMQSTNTLRSQVVTPKENGFSVTFTFLNTVSGDGNCREAAARWRRRRGAAATRRKQQAIGGAYLFRIARVDCGWMVVAGRRARV